MVEILQGRSRGIRLLAAMALLLWLAPAVAPAQTILRAMLDGAQEVPPVATGGTGNATAILSADEATLRVKIDFSGLNGNHSAAHIHGPGLPGAGAGIVLDLGFASGTTSGSLDQVYDLSFFPSFVIDDFEAGFYYVNVHSSSAPGGEIRGQLEGNVALDGAQEVPPAATAGTGSATARLSPDESELEVHLSFQNLGSNQTAAHIHGPAAPGAGAGVVLDLGLSTGATSGRLDQTYDLSSFPSFDLADFKSDLYYFNVHSVGFPDGEIRGQAIFCGQPTTTLVTDTTVMSLESFLACDEVSVGVNVGVVGPNGHAVFSAIDRVVIDNGLDVGFDAQMTVAVGHPLFECP